MKTHHQTLFNTIIVLLVATNVPGQTNKTVSIPGNSNTNAPTICRCQIVEVIDQDNSIELVGLFAEKGKSSKQKRDTRMMDALIAKEKNYLRKGFVFKLQVLDHISADSDCITLYYSLRRFNKKMKMHDVLNADFLQSLAGR
jgi:hypothetical protein